MTPHQNSGSIAPLDRNSLKRGDLVDVLDWQGKRLKKRVVRTSGQLVFVCTDEESSASRAEQHEPIIVGWPAESVAELAHAPSTKTSLHL